MLSDNKNSQKGQQLVKSPPAFYVHTCAKKKTKKKKKKKRKHELTKIVG